MVLSGPKWSKVIQSGPNDPKWSYVVLNGFVLESFQKCNYYWTHYRLNYITFCDCSAVLRNVWLVNRFKLWYWSFLKTVNHERMSMVKISVFFRFSIGFIWDNFLWFSYIITVRWSGLVWHNLSNPHHHISVQLLKSSSNWTKLSMIGRQLFSGWYQMI